MMEQQFIFLFFVGVVWVWVVAWFSLLVVYGKIIKRWAIGPPLMQMEGFLFLFLPYGVFQIWKAGRMNKNRTYPKSIRSVFVNK